MNRCEQRHRIIKVIEKTDNWDMLDKIEDMFTEEPKYIRDFIEEMIKKNYPNGFGTKNYHNHYYNEGIIDAFETDVRRIYIEIKNKIIPDDEYISHWSELYVKDRGYEEELDLWISGQDYLFDSRELAWVIFNIWCGKITFNR